MNKQVMLKAIPEISGTMCRGNSVPGAGAGLENETTDDPGLGMAMPVNSGPTSRSRMGLLVTRR